MLIDINLLPAKKKKNVSLLVLAVTALVLLLLAAALFAGVELKQKQVERAEQELATQQQLREVLEQAAAAGTNATAQSSAEQLREAVEWSQARRLPASPVLEHLVSLLPDRGFFQSMSYATDETMNITIQFDTGRQGAYYLTELKSSEWVEQASLLQVDTSVEQSETDAKALLEVTDGLPRYIVQYEIQFDEQQVLQALKEQRNE